VVELDSAGDIQMCNFPVFNLSEVDKTTLKAERGTDGTLKVMMRGDVYDGRAFVKSSLANVPEHKSKKSLADMDLDIKLGAVAGHHGEALRGLELRLARRAGQIRAFSLQAKLGRDTPLIGDLRGRAGGRDVIYLETNDAGAFFRFTDTYPRMYGGQMWVAF